ncbi:MAG: hypothetical protein EOP00_37180 [Pedobacter sp.]|nr:MAG: hypothetical protein EOP00_37180 [Pedobacter sp.]
MIRQLTFLFFFAITLFSCQKEINSENEILPTPLPSDSIYISKVIGLDTTKAAPLDTLYVANYIYDNLKRVVSYTYLTYGNTGMVDSVFCLIVSKKYSGNDTLPVKQIAWTKETTNKWVDTSYFQYQTGTSAIIYDSTISKDIEPQSTDIYTSAEKYTHSTNAISRKISNYLNNTFLSSDVFSYSFTKLNGNILTQQDDAWGSTNSFICTYDNKKNPFNEHF